MKPFIINSPKASPYVLAWKAVINNPSNLYKMDKYSEAKTGEQHRKDFMGALHRRINSRDGQEWRNVQTLKEIEEQRDARDANTPRLIIRRFRTPRLNIKLSHRLFTE